MVRTRGPPRLPTPVTGPTRRPPAVSARRTPRTGLVEGDRRAVAFARGISDLRPAPSCCCPAQPTEPESGWRPDPSGVHEERWFKDGEPTVLVRDNGIGSLETAAGTGAPRGLSSRRRPRSPRVTISIMTSTPPRRRLASVARRLPLEGEGGTPGSLDTRKSHVSGVTRWLRAPLFLACYLVAYVVVGIVVALLAVSLLSHSHVSSHGVGQTTIGFADALALAVAAIALIAAVLAFPSLVAWVWRQLNEPKMTMAFAACRDLDSLPQGADEGGLAVTVSEDHTFIVRVGLFNSGRATLEHGSFNFHVPAGEYRIKALDDPSKRHAPSCSLGPLHTGIRADRASCDTPPATTISHPGFPTCSMPR